MQPAPQAVRELQVGDFLPEFNLADQMARWVALNTHALGQPLVLLFYPDNHKPACQQLLRSFAALDPRLADLAQIFAINGETVEANATAVDMQGLPFRLLSDPTGVAAESYGVAHNLPGAALDFLGSGAFTSIIADENRRILKIDRNVTDPAHAEALVAWLEARPQPAPMEMPGVAPVLCVPRVLERDFCRALIEAYETRGNEPSGTLHDSRGGAQKVKLDPSLKVRRDHHVRDPALHDRIRVAIKARVLPEIYKAYHYRVTSFEEFKIVCYEARDGGHFAPHRDNNSLSSAHRRFAMTLNLNTEDYEGGHLRFPEYGPHLYRPGTGDAVIFSCSLVHQALPVTAGRRFVLLSFFFGDEAMQTKDQRDSGRQAGAMR